MTFQLANLPRKSPEEENCTLRWRRARQVYALGKEANQSVYFDDRKDSLF